jgi:hypothetical protein
MVGFYLIHCQYGDINLIKHREKESNYSSFSIDFQKEHTMTTTRNNNAKKITALALCFCLICSDVLCQCINLHRKTAAHATSQEVAGADQQGCPVMQLQERLGKGSIRAAPELPEVTGHPN